jgi:Na+/H+-dicarboxylate symporter
MAIASLIIGIVSFFTAVVVFGGLLGIVGLILGIAALGRARRLQGTGRGVAITGLITSALAVLITLIVVFTVVPYISNHRPQFRQFTRCMDRAADAQERTECWQRFTRHLTSQ